MNRREFIKFSAFLSAMLTNIKDKNVFASQSLRILILGGTRFIGPHLIETALLAGHKVSIFNRGITVLDQNLANQVEILIGDRENNLDALKNRTWDVVIDNHTSLPKWVFDLSKVLKGNIGHYIFISTISVYADLSIPNTKEDAKLLNYTGMDCMSETIESMHAHFRYGQLKVQCELQALQEFFQQCLIIRPGLIVGPLDPTDRFTYWPVRIFKGGEIAAPGNPKDPVQFIDVRDLSKWIIHMAENQEKGIYNACGPIINYTIGEMLNAFKECIKPEAKLTWIDDLTLEKNNISGWKDMPVWISPRSSSKGMLQINIDKAINKGLTCRSCEITALDTLNWVLEKHPYKFQKEKLLAGLSEEREMNLLNEFFILQGPK